LSAKEQLTQLIADMPEWMAEHALNLLNSFIMSVAEAADDEFCIKMVDNGLADPEDGEWVPIEEVAAQLGVELE